MVTEVNFFVYPENKKSKEKIKMDVMVLKVQKWLNDTYGQDSRFNRITEDGKTGWGTIYLWIKKSVTN
jgi:hypothetical protein